MTTKPYNKPYNKRHKVEQTRLDDIVKKLPLLRFLDESKAILLGLEPQWHAWRKKHLPNLAQSAAHLSALTENTLTIHANNASTAALIKSQLSSLRKALNQTSNLSIKNIKVIIDLETTSAARRTQQQFVHKDDNASQKNKPNQMAIDSISSLQSSIKNPDLSESLENLAQTLKNFSNS